MPGTYISPAETGLYYLQSRYYNPIGGKFINADIYASSRKGLHGYNFFAYCLNNPAKHADYNGLDAIVLCKDGPIGHTGIMVQDENGVWWNFYWGASSFLGAVFDNTGTNTWCKQYAGELTLEAINASGQYSSYTDMLYFKGDFSEAIEEIKEPSGGYSLYTNNCTMKSLRILSYVDTCNSEVFSEASKIIHPGKAFQYLVDNRKDNNNADITVAFLFVLKVLRELLK